MESFGVTLQFPSQEICAAFADRIETLDLAGQPFSLANTEESLHSDNELLTLLIMFMENGGLPALTAFIGLMGGFVRELMPGKSITIKHKGKSVVVTGTLSPGQIKEIVDALTDGK